MYVCMGVYICIYIYISSSSQSITSHKQQREPELLAAEPCGGNPITEVDTKTTMMRKGKMKSVKLITTQTSELSTSIPNRVSAATPGSPGRPEPHTHPRTFRKIQDWSLEVRKSTLFVGDSNLSRIPSFTDPDIQVDSYPGATFHHITAILKKLQPQTDTQHVILSFGLNNCLSEHEQTTILKQLQQMVKTGHTTFPNATIYIPVINFSNRLNRQQQALLTTLNNTITSKYTFLAEINPFLFQTAKDNIHWTADTADMLFKYWKQQLN